MFFELIGTIVAGVAAALLVWALNRSLKGRLPSWLVPVSAGAAMLLATISSEYSWFARAQSNMPEGFVVAETVEEKKFYRPWTFARPFVSRFIAIDQATIRSHPAHPEQRIVDLVIYGRWARTAKIPALFDCAMHSRADLVDGVEFGDDGQVLNADWHPMEADAPLLRAACFEV
ncbi:hypothetical protein HKX54_11500 [Sulfitobacter sp. M57]|uniref:hypothetical protein n=1 Tax=unclassified Sulfitobacter TaxID=196795 RepID=UPI0023E0E615|nr:MULTISPECIES: hypothetical protein [unclassified Sulfitobacter]MDF3415082.1 hypothetical protein [Sulfitobacter sp. KE5]MDF3422563.1 hypothetical protein [Sulfitobacter sp. KE43]MDF3433628.1 hypothetical protein [Sulfitobacter sp. KE42]MDF3459268.1 hypothetical protein [Sulfitobacter sp. S74]MDF3463167.1 hypothetical protein [Sulfitobacter sp. Ks18]